MATKRAIGKTWYVFGCLLVLGGLAYLLVSVLRHQRTDGKTLDRSWVTSGVKLAPLDADWARIAFEYIHPVRRESLQEAMELLRERQCVVLDMSEARKFLGYEPERVAHRVPCLVRSAHDPRYLKNMIVEQSGERLLLTYAADSRSEYESHVRNAPLVLFLLREPKEVYVQPVCVYRTPWF